MTMTLKIEHVSGSQYQARIKKEGSQDVVLKQGESAEIGIHSGTFLTVVEEPATQPSEGEGNAESTAPATLGSQVEKLQDAANGEGAGQEAASETVTG